MTRCRDWTIWSVRVHVCCLNHPDDYVLGWGLMKGGMNIDLWKRILCFSWD